MKNKTNDKNKYNSHCTNLGIINDTNYLNEIKKIYILNNLVYPSLLKMAI